jgi:hypothetical protein
MGVDEVHLVSKLVREEVLSSGYFCATHIIGAVSAPSAALLSLLIYFIYNF